MKLTSLKGKNFKADDGETLRLGQITSITGANGVGKSTKADLYNWIIFGKDSLGNQMEGEVKPHGNQNLETTGEAVFVSEGGVPTKFEKRLKENREGIRGKEPGRLQGHDITYLINGGKTTATDYREALDHLIGQARKGYRWNLLSNVLWFQESDYKDRRAMLMDTFGDVTDEEVFASSKKLAELERILGVAERSLADHQRFLKTQKPELVKQLEEFPVRISEVKGTLPTSEESSEVPEVSLQDLNAQLAELQQKKVRLESGGEVSAKRKELADLETAAITIANSAKTKASQAHTAAQTALNQAENAYMQASRAVTNVTSEVGTLANLRRQLANQTQERAELLARHKERSTEQFEGMAGEDTCPSCGQKLPPEKIANALEKARGEFNLAKSRDLERMVERGKPMTTACKSLQEQIAAIEQGLPELQKAEADAKTARDTAKRTVDAATVAEPDLTADPVYTANLEQQKAVKQAIEQLAGGNAEALESVEAEIQETQQKISAVQAIEAQAGAHDKAKSRIIELGEEEKQVAIKLENYEKELDLCAQFNRAKIKLLSDKIHPHFKFARFELFADNMTNDGLTEKCDVTYLGLPPSHGQQIKLGLDIINAFSKAWGVTAPCWIDNSEAVSTSEWIDTEGQQIRLAVLPDKKVCEECGKPCELNDAERSECHDAGVRLVPEPLRIETQGN